MVIVMCPSGCPNLCLFASRDIRAAEELRYDYGGGRSPRQKKTETRISTGKRHKSTYDDDSVVSNSYSSAIYRDESDEDYNPLEDESASVDLEGNGDTSEIEEDHCESRLSDELSEVFPMYNKASSSTETITGCHSVSSSTSVHQEDKLYMQQSVVGGEKRQLKNHSCLYCEKQISKMARHLEQVHADELEVAKVLNLTKKSKERRAAWAALVNKGDFNHNYSVIENGSGCIIPRYRARPTQLSQTSDYVPCEYCWAMYVKTDLWKHQKTCPLNENVHDKAKRNEPIKNGKLLLPLKVKSRALYANILLHMVDDEVRYTIESDPLLTAYGVRLYEKYGHEIHNRSYIANKLRELGRLILSIRKITSTKTDLESCIEPVNWELLLQGVREVAGYDEKNHSYKTPSLPLKLGASLMKCAKLLQSTGLIETNDEKIKKAQAFLDLYASEWSDRISTVSRSTLRENQYNRPRLLPLIEDVVKLQKHLSGKIEEKLSEMAQDINAYVDIVQLTLAQVILFNRRRSGEAERMKLSDYETAVKNKTEPSREVQKSLSKFEVHLCKSHTRVETKGK